MSATVKENVTLASLVEFRGRFGRIDHARERAAVEQEHEDPANVCDRVLVLRRGRIVAELAGASLSNEAILAQCHQTEGAGA